MIALLWDSLGGFEFYRNTISLDYILSDAEIKLPLMLPNNWNYFYFTPLYTFFSISK